MTPVRAAEWTEYLKTVDTPTLSNAIERLNVRPRKEGFTPLEIRCLFPEFGRMCGWAVTAHVETISTGYPDNESAFPPLFQAIADSPKPAVVVFQELGAHPLYAAHCGEVMATVFSRLGAAGLVSDCGVRDIPEVRALGFHYFARGTAASHGNFRVVRVGEPVQIRGLTVRPGDLLHGDENGLIAVPAAGLDELPQAVEAVRSSERAILDFVRGPDFNIADLVRRFYH
jgi:4-hydroxy-4-methyl-2-oxoglutarate aldolase